MTATETDRTTSVFSDVADHLLDRVDPVGFVRSLTTTALKAAEHPVEVAMAGARFATRAAMVGPVAMARLGGVDVPDVVPAIPGDRRFDDPTWARNPLYHAMMQLYLLERDLVFDLIDAADLDAAAHRKATFAASFLTDAMAPTNTLPGNPAALRKAVETRGASVVAGLRNLIHDVRHNQGWPSQVDASPFEVGVNMATTPGKVVFRSDLIELIQYEPTTEQVHEIPLLFCPPWINKYYIMDLAPGRSLIRWAIDHGHTCFVISYRNPDETMADTTFEDYLFGGPLTAARVVSEITGVDRVNTLSVCLGGTLTAMAMAHEANAGTSLINSATLINTHTDFELPGNLGAFTDPDTVASLERRMAKNGYLEASDMATTFDALRANDLIFQYVVNNWLMGNQPPAFDLLAWNGDSTRMPARMHTTYLRTCYLENQFSQGRFKVRNRLLKPNKVARDTFVLSAVDDHIVPWESAYRTTQLLGGENTFVLSTSGHIAGIVNPPSKKAKHWTNPQLPADPHEWLADAELHDETWWESWATWAAERGGPLVPARRPGSDDHPPIEDAPGSYVKARA